MPSTNDFTAAVRSIDLMIRNDLSPTAQRDLFVAFASDEDKDFVAAYRAAVGAPAGKVDAVFERFVSQREVRGPEGIRKIEDVYRVRALAGDRIRARAIALLETHVKVRSGALRRSLAVYHNRARTNPRADVSAPPGTVIRLTYLAAHARKGEFKKFNMEGGRRRGLLNFVAKELKREFKGEAASIKFTNDVFDDSELIGTKAKAPSRLPAIVIRL